MGSVSNDDYDRHMRRPTPDGVSSPWQRYGWLLSVIWLGFLYYPGLELVDSDAPAWWVGLGWVALVAFAGSYLAGFILGMRRGWHDPSPLASGLFFTILGCAALTVPAIGWGSTSFVPFVMAYASYVLGPRWHWTVNGCGLAVLAVRIVVALATGEEPPWVLIGVVLSMTAVNSINVWLIGRSIASEELSMELAMSEERESIARDVHDMLGHSLTIVKLKAELAMRLLDKDPAATRAELEAISRLTGEAISGVRGTVTGLRVEGLAQQLSASRSALESAGISVTVSGEASALSPAQSLTAGWILREATTNVLRHAQARSVRIEVDPGTMTVEDDGVGICEKPGNGLRGMAERAAAAGAVLRIGPGETTDGGTRVGLTW